RVNDRASAAPNARCVPMWRIGFLIIAGGREARPAHCASRYDVAASESQIEFGEATIMETNGLIGWSAGKLHASRTHEGFRLFHGRSGPARGNGPPCPVKEPRSWPKTARFFLLGE